MLAPRTQRTPFDELPSIYGMQEEGTGSSAHLIVPAVFAGMLILGAGTGGTHTPAFIQREICTRTSVISIRPAHLEADADGQFVSVPLRLAQVRRFLSLNVSDLGKVLRVERPTIYSWLSGRSVPHAANRNRVDQIFTIARQWRKLSPNPVGRFLREPMISESLTLFDTLCAVQINNAAVKRLFIAIRPLVKYERAVRDSRSMREMAELHGFQSPSEQRQRIAFEEEADS